MTLGRNHEKTLPRSSSSLAAGSAHCCLLVLEDDFNRTLTVSGAVNLDLTTGSGEVTIKTGGSNQVVVHGTSAQQQ